ncbi:hypothetical protein KF840_20410 [bacterium]|nr:hypothetical protein [bacterium]
MTPARLLLVLLLAAALAACGDSDAAPRATPSALPSATHTASATETATAIPTATHGVTARPTATAPPSATATASSTATASATPPPSATPTDTPDGFVAAAIARQRQLDYLRYATTRLLPGSITNVIAHMQRARVDPTFAVTPGAVPADAWDAIFRKLETLQDTRDFEAIELVTVLYDYADDPLLAPGLSEKVEQALLTFKFWYTEPTPEGAIDESYYWTENHQALYHAIEYLVAQRYPDRAIGRDGRSGAEHLAHARDLLLQWLDFRARYGFTEWHSNVYYQEDHDALLTLAEFAADPAIQQRAAAMLDVLLFDLAVHTHRGNFGVTHGRSYKKDKMSGRDDDTWNVVRLLFDRSEGDYTSIGDSAAVFQARATRYRLPEAIWRAGRSSATLIDRERMSLPLAENGPYVEHPVAPGGYSFSDPRDLPIWWGMQALTAWEVVPLTVQTIDQYDLWDTQLFSRFRALRPLTADIVAAQKLSALLGPLINFGLLEEVNTYTYRTADYLLSSALDHRPGALGGQIHAWQATFGADAILFTQHPAVPIVQSTAWRDDPDPGYWTGEASLPRSAQVENVAIHIYAPQYPGMNPPPLDGFRYEPYTHAYVPQDHFDEVAQDGPWTFVRRADGYAALYSYRPTEWIVVDPALVATNGMTRPFDLRANGGPDNVWIIECGRAADWGSFDAFRAAVAGAAVSVAPRPPVDGRLDGFDVTYDSPSQGRLAFGWQAPFTRDGIALPIRDFPRRDNPWSQTAYGSPRTAIDVEGHRVDLDFELGTRRISAADH